MATGASAWAFNRRDSLRTECLVSVAGHALLFIAILIYGGVNFRRGHGWGAPGSNGSVHVGVVTSLPGMPLPAPMLATHNTLATQNPGLYQTPEVKTVPPPDALEVPKFEASAKEPPPKRINTRIQQPPQPPPPNAIPFGAGGPPSMSYGQFVNSQGEGAFSFGQGNFGDRYGWYVEAVRNRISSNWLMATISPNVTMARRVFVHFEIQRDGSIANVKLTQSSGDSEVDRSALRAVYASSPLGALPPDFSGQRVAVDFYFDFHR